MLLFLIMLSMQSTSASVSPRYSHSPVPVSSLETQRLTATVQDKHSDNNLPPRREAMLLTRKATEGRRQRLDDRPAKREIPQLRVMRGASVSAGRHSGGAASVPPAPMQLLALLLANDSHTAGPGVQLDAPATATR